MKPIIYDISKSTIEQVSSLQAETYKIVPYGYSEGILKVLIDKQRNVNGICRELEVITGKKIELQPVEASVIETLIEKHYSLAEQSSGKLNLKSLYGKKETLIAELISEAIGNDCSDIHFEAREINCRVRFRIDGQLVDKYFLPKTEYPSIINAIKIKANLDIAEKRLPQDGRILFASEKGNVDLRVSIIPTVNGEKIVLRILNKDTSSLELKKIGFSTQQFKDYQKGILSSNGIVLISGPTGSGKTTTLYATLKQLNTKERNILTIEDPIEYTLEGINQVQLKEDIGLSFPMALRTFLRQDPDIIMIGEIRDSETAQIAIRSALTGHLVLSTIHTNSSLGTVSRLIDMGIPPYLISATLNVAVAQRLIRMLCNKCKTTSDNQNPLIKDFFPGQHVKAFKATGCPYCNHTGYRGRRAIFEVLPVEKDTREAIKSGTLNFQTIPDNIQSIKDQAKEAFFSGDTSFEEILPILLNS